MRRSRNAPATRVVFDIPVAFVELLYGRAALGLDVLADLPAPAPVPERVAAPDGAAERWLRLYESAVDQFATQGEAATWGRLMPGWLSAGDAGAVDAERARGWVRTQRALVIDSALTTVAMNGQRVHRRGRSLDGLPIAGVVVLPVVGPYDALPVPGVLIVSLATFLDDDLWAAALARHC